MCSPRAGAVDSLPTGSLQSRSLGGLELGRDYQCHTSHRRRGGAPRPAPADRAGIARQRLRPRSRPRAGTGGPPGGRRRHAPAGRRARRRQEHRPGAVRGAGMARPRPAPGPQLADLDPGTWRRAGAGHRARRRGAGAGARLHRGRERGARRRARVLRAPGTPPRRRGGQRAGRPARRHGRAARSHAGPGQRRAAPGRGARAGLARGRGAAARRAHHRALLRRDRQDARRARQPALDRQVPADRQPLAGRAAGPGRRGHRAAAGRIGGDHGRRRGRAPGQGPVGRRGAQGAGGRRGPGRPWRRDPRPDRHHRPRRAGAGRGAGRPSPARRRPRLPRQRRPDAAGRPGPARARPRLPATSGRARRAGRLAAPVGEHRARPPPRTRRDRRRAGGQDGGGRASEHARLPAHPRGAAAHGARPRAGRAAGHAGGRLSNQGPRPPAGRAGVGAAAGGTRRRRRRAAGHGRHRGAAGDRGPRHGHGRRPAQRVRAGPRHGAVAIGVPAEPPVRPAAARGAAGTTQAARPGPGVGPVTAVGVAARLAGLAAAGLAVALAWTGLVAFGGGSVPGSAGALAGTALLRPESLAVAATGAAPLLLAGLAVAIGLRAGVINLGVQGQALAGALAAVLVQDRLRAPAGLLLAVTVLAAMAAGLAWALLPALLRAWRGVPEALTTVLGSFVAVALIAAVPLVWQPPPARPRAGIGNLAVPLREIAPGAAWPSLLTWTVPVALLGAIAMVLALRASRVGPRLRAMLDQPRAALLAGVRPRLVATTALLLSGAVAGLVGLQDVLAHGAPVAGGLCAVGTSAAAPLAGPAAPAPVAVVHLPDYGLLAVAVVLAARVVRGVTVSYQARATRRPARKRVEEPAGRKATAPEQPVQEPAEEPLLEPTIDDATEGAHA